MEKRSASDVTRILSHDYSIRRYDGHPGMNMRIVKEAMYKKPSVDQAKIHMEHLRIMLSYGMSGKTEKEVEDAIKRCIAVAESGMSSLLKTARNDIGFACTYVDNWECKAPDDAQGIGRLYFLGNAIIGMDTIDAIVIDPLLYENPLGKWPSGCQIERMVANLYKIPILNDIFIMHKMHLHIDGSTFENLYGSLLKFIALDYIDKEQEKEKH